MWQEARKQEKHIKTLMVDYKRRAERRRDYYERIKQDPIKFLRVYGRPAKLNLDSEVAKAAENPTNMMPWVADPTVSIDRFDARANLEHYDSQISDEPRLTPVEKIEERLCMYERYRCLIHNDYASVTEAMALKQIELDEKYGDLEKKRREDEANKKPQEPKAAIGFVYEDSSQELTPTPTNTMISAALGEDSESEGEADSDMDIDVELDLSTIGMEGRRQLAKSAASFGLHPSDFVRLLDADQQLETELRLAKALEEEKLQLAGRKSRRARRLLKERRAQEKFPKLLTTKVGLLNGQPISRRTVYLSASSSDSGDFPSEDEVEGGLSPVRDPTSKAMAIRAQRARAKPILTNARGPSVMIGGMTSISLCRRHRKLDVECEDKSRGNDRSSSSNSSASRDHHRRDSSGSSNRSSRRSRYGRKWHRTKRSRVEYITTFGGNEEEEKPDRPGRNSTSGGKLPWQSDKPPGTAASAVAASVVSKIFGAHERPSPSSQRNTVDSRPSHGCSSFRRSGMSRNRSSSSERSSGYRRRSRSRSDRDYRGGTKLTRSRFSHSRSSSRDSGSSYGRHRSDSRAKDPSYRSSGSRRRSSSGKLSRSPSPDRLRSISNHSPHSADQDDSSRITYYRPGEPLNRENSRTRDASPTPVRKRYYRPELESDKEVDLSDEDDEVDTRKRGPNASTNRSGGRQNWRSNTADSRGNSVGKMTSQSLTGESNYSSTSKSASSGPLAVCGVRLTPQELLKRRVQLQLTKAFNADKKAELEKQIQLEHERQVREEGLRRQARLLRRQEERRVRAERRAAAAASGNTVDSSSDSSSSKSMSSGDKTETRSRTSRSSFARSSPTVPARQTTPSYKSSKLRSPSPHGFRSRRRSSSRGSSHKISGRLPSPPSASDSQEFGKGRGFPSAFDGSHNSPFMKRHETELPRNSRQQEFNVGRFRGSGRPYSGYRDNRSNRPPGSDAFSHRGQSWQGNGNSRACPNAERRRPGASPPRESQWNSSSRAYQSRGRYETCFRGSQYPRRP